MRLLCGVSLCFCLLIHSRYYFILVIYFYRCLFLLLIVAQMVDGKSELRFSGLDLTNGAIRDNLHAGVVEPAISKIKSLRFATEAAVSILRIDDMIKLNPARQQQHGH